jgi:hypothetical protein
VIPPIGPVTVGAKVQAVTPVTRKLLPDEEEPRRKGERRAPPKKTQTSRAPISAVSAWAEARSSSAVQSALTDLKLGL